MGAATTSALTTLVIPLLLFFGAVSVYRLVFHPLARVPGPRIAAITNAWHAFHARNGRMLELGKTLHRRYGPAVRVGPNEVWFDSVDAYQTIYSSCFALPKQPRARVCDDNTRF